MAPTREPFSMVSRSIIESGITDAELRLYALVLTAPTDHPWEGIKAAADALGWEARRVRRNLEALERYGLIVQKHHGSQRVTITVIHAPGKNIVNPDVHVPPTKIVPKYEDPTRFGTGRELPPEPPRGGAVVDPRGGAVVDPQVAHREREGRTTTRPPARSHSQARSRKSIKACPNGHAGCDPTNTVGSTCTPCMMARALQNPPSSPHSAQVALEAPSEGTSTPETVLSDSGPLSCPHGYEWCQYPDVEAEMCGPCLVDLADPAYQLPVGGWDSDTL